MEEPFSFGTFNLKIVRLGNNFFFTLPYFNYRYTQLRLLSNYIELKIQQQL